MPRRPAPGCGGGGGGRGGEQLPRPRGASESEGGRTLRPGGGRAAELGGGRACVRAGRVRVHAWAREREGSHPSGPSETSAGGMALPAHGGGWASEGEGPTGKGPAPSCPLVPCPGEPEQPLPSCHNTAGVKA